MPYELINKEQLLDVNDCPFVYREEESEAEGKCRKGDGYKLNPHYMYRSKEVFAPRFGYFGEQRGRFWVERHVPINNSAEVQNSFYAQNQSPFYAEKHIYDSNLSHSGAYLTPPPLMRVTTNVQEVPRQHITCQQQGPTYNYKN